MPIPGEHVVARAEASKELSPKRAKQAKKVWNSVINVGPTGRHRAIQLYEHLAKSQPMAFINEVVLLVTRSQKVCNKAGIPRYTSLRSLNLDSRCSKSELAVTGESAVAQKERPPSLSVRHPDLATPEPSSVL